MIVDVQMIKVTEEKYVKDVKPRPNIQSEQCNEEEEEKKNHYTDPREIKTLKRNREKILNKN